MTIAVLLELAHGFQMEMMHNGHGMEVMNCTLENRI